MKHYEIYNLLKYSTMPKFLTRKWIAVNDLLGGIILSTKIIRFKTPMLRSDLCDYSDPYIGGEWRITFEDTNDANKINK